MGLNIEEERKDRYAQAGRKDPGTNFTGDKYGYKYTTSTTVPVQPSSQSYPKSPSRMPAQATRDPRVPYATQSARTRPPPPPGANKWPVPTQPKTLDYDLKIIKKKTPRLAYLAETQNPNLCIAWMRRYYEVPEKFEKMLSEWGNAPDRTVIQSLMSIIKCRALEDYYQRRYDGTMVMRLLEGAIESEKEGRLTESSEINVRRIIATYARLPAPFRAHEHKIVANMEYEAEKFDKQLAMVDEAQA